VNAFVHNGVVVKLEGTPVEEKSGLSAKRFADAFIVKKKTVRSGTMAMATRTPYDRGDG
jgi:hypothetical protein